MDLQGISYCRRSCVKQDLFTSDLQILSQYVTQSDRNYHGKFAHPTLVGWTINSSAEHWKPL